MTHGATPPPRARLAASREGAGDDGPGPGDEEAAQLDAILTGRAVWPLFQPIVELDTRAPAGYESLARGPADHPLRSPAALFGAARRAHRLTELDTLCRARAMDTALRAGLRSPRALFVNVEPGALGSGSPLTVPPPALTRLQEQGVTVFAELTERALTDHPAQLVGFAERVRTWGCGIAIDDVGAEPASLALVPLLRPDVVKLDLRVIQDRPDAAVARTMTAVTAFAEAHAAAVVAEGVETEEHERAALSLGATHGQGWRYGHPRPAGEAMCSRPLPRHPIVPQPERRHVGRESAFGLVGARRTARQGTKRLLIEVSRLLERQAADMDGLAVVLATVEDAQQFGAEMRARYAAMADRAAFVAALGAGLPTEPAPGVRGAGLAPGDPLCDEWDVVVVGPHFAAALVARDRHEDGREADRRFDYVLTYDRPTVLEVARLLLSRVGSR